MAPEPGTLFIQFARTPVVGRVKTRMQPALSAQGACELHQALLHHTYQRLLGSGLGPVELWLSEPPGAGSAEALALAGISADCWRFQSGADLGERMLSALRDGLRRFRQVILVGSDCPGLDRAYLLQAMQALQQSPVVLGPAEDGGYVLIGVTDVRLQLFQSIDWGSERVLAQTQAQLRGLGWPWANLAPLADIDRPEDLPLWEALRTAP